MCEPNIAITRAENVESEFRLAGIKSALKRSVNIP